MPLSGAALEAIMRKAGAEAINDAADDLLADAVQKAPLEEGTLRQSGRIELEASPARLHARVAFGTPYGAAQHEGHAIQHRRTGTVNWQVRRYSHPGTGPKYLEGPLKAMIPRFGAFVAKRVRAVF